MNQFEELVSNYQILESDVHKFEKLKLCSEEDEDQKFWTIEIETTKKEMKSISLKIFKLGPKAA